VGLVASSGIEPELSALRGRRVNQLHHDATQREVYQNASDGKEKLGPKSLEESEFNALTGQGYAVVGIANNTAQSGPLVFKNFMGER
jgi:hypothetical protein